MSKDLERKCKHEILLHTGTKEGVGKIGNCYDCDSIRKITENYQFISGGVYRLKKIEVNALECRE